MPNIETRIDGSVLHISISRPDAKNALSIDMYQQLVEALLLLEQSAELNVGYIYGSETCFCAGNDLKDFLASSELNEQHPTVKFIRSLSTCKKPLIAAVAGPAIGIGTTMLLHCDMVIAANNSKFQLPFVQLGLCPEAGSSLLLPKMAGHVKSFEYLVLGTPFGAEQAYQMGVVNQVVDEHIVIDVGLKVAHAISALPTEAVIESKRLMKQPSEAQLHKAVNDELTVFSKLLNSAECQSRVGAFFKR